MSIPYNEKWKDNLQNDIQIIDKHTELWCVSQENVIRVFRTTTQIMIEEILGALSFLCTLQLS